jgi:hypothetical protein
MQYPMIAQPQYGFAPTMPMMANGGSVADAQSVQSKGRGRDTMLVHMTPKEVGGLQALAMQHGGSLTINPQTGLPEAGFLENMLPTLIGAGLMMVPGLQGVGAGYIGAGVGAVEALRTGDIGQGLLAGLGAYGGANLAGSLGAAGASTAASAAPGVTEAVASGALPQTAASVVPSAAPTAGQTLLGETALQASFPSASTSGAGSLLAVNPVTAATTMGATLPTGATAAGEGIRALGTEAGRDAFMSDIGGYTGLAKQAGMAAAPALLATPEYDAPAPKKEEASNYEGPYTPSARRVSYPGDDERRRTSEFTYFTPSNPVPFDAGGKVEEDRSVKMPDASYVAGQAPEFDHNFKAVEVEGGFPSAPISPDVSGISSGLMQLMGSSIKDAAKNQANEQIRTMAGYEYDPRSQRLVKGSSTGGLPALARGGSVPTLENGGFVLTKKAVDGLGRGNNEKGQANAQRGLGAIPIRGAGAKRGPKAGVDDKIKTTIDGKRPALVSNGEAYVPKKQVAKKGGAKAFYALMKQAEKAADKRRRA